MGRLSAITSVMNLCVPCSMPLAHAITGVPVASARSKRASRGAQMLRGDGKQDRIVAADRIRQRRDTDAVVELDPRQTRALAGCLQSFGDCLIARSQQHGAAGTRDDIRQCRTPGTRADDCNMVKRHDNSELMSN